MIKADKYYIDNLNKLIKEGIYDENPRPKYADGTSAHTKFITQVFEEYDINKGEFPIPTLRNTAVKTGIKEIFWIYQKQSNSLKEARDLGINWWDSWNIGDDTIGVRYGETVKRHNLINQLLEGLKNNPFGRRHIINLWQEADLKASKGLDPCAFQTLWSVRKIATLKGEDEIYLDCTLIQRSNDYLVAGYINKIQYVALQMMVAGHCGYKPGKFCHLTQNLHVYDRHEEAFAEILKRTPDENAIQPKLILSENKNFFDYTMDDFSITGTEGIKKIESTLELAI